MSTTTQTGRGCIPQKRWTKVVEEVEQDQKQRLQAAYLAAQKHIHEWGIKYILLGTQPKVGSTLSNNPAPHILHLIFDSKTGIVAVYGLAVNRSEYVGLTTLDPKWSLAYYGNRGMKIFLTRGSRDALEKTHVKEFDEARKFGHSTFEHVGSIKVISYAKSGKAANGELWAN